MGAETFAIMALSAGAIKAYGDYSAGKQEKKGYEYNAGISDEQAIATRTSAALNDFKKRKAIASGIGAQRAAYAAAGVDINTGSPLKVMTDSLANANLDLEIDKYNSEVAARQFESRADMERYYGKQAERTGKINAITSLISAGANYGAKQTTSKTKVGE